MALHMGGTLLLFFCTISTKVKYLFKEPRSGRVASQAEVPGELLDQLIEFLESTADSVNLTPLVQV